MERFCANLLDIKERCAPSSNSMLASAHLPFTQTGATPVFSKQTGMLAGLVADSGGMIAGVTAVESSDVPSGLLMANDDFGSETDVRLCSDIMWLSTIEAGVMFLFAGLTTKLQHTL